MVKSNELREGNLFHPVSSAGGIKMPATAVMFKVVELLAFKCRAVMHDQYPAQVEQWTEFEYSEMYPVPIKTEILEKCGFIETENNGEFVNCQRGILFFNFDRLGLPEFRIGYLTFTTVHYLHQLQNLYLDLTGEELTINFKDLTYQ